MRAREEAVPWDQMTTRMAAMEVALVANNVVQIRKILQELVSGYRPAEEIVDWVHLEQMRQVRREEERLVANG